MNSFPCTEKDCTDLVYARYMCKHHYNKWRMANMHRLPGARRSWVNTQVDQMRFWEGKCEDDAEAAFWEGSWNEHHHLTGYTLEPRRLVIKEDVLADARWDAECNLYDESSGPASSLPVGYSIVERPEEQPKPRRPKKDKPGRGQVSHGDYIGPIPGEDLSIKLPPARKPRKEKVVLTGLTGLTVKETAEKLHTTSATIYGWINSRGLPTVRVGKNLKQLRIPEDALQEWLDNGKRPKTEVPKPKPAKKSRVEDLPGMSLKDVATRLRLSEGAVRTLIGSGALPAKQYSGTWRITRFDLYEWIERSFPDG
jgi:excisionase family DNA binding protein